MFIKHLVVLYYQIKQVLNDINFFVSFIGFGGSIFGISKYFFITWYVTFYDAYEITNCYIFCK